MAEVILHSNGPSRHQCDAAAAAYFQVTQWRQWPSVSLELICQFSSRKSCIEACRSMCSPRRNFTRPVMPGFGKAWLPSMPARAARAVPCCWAA